MTKDEALKMALEVMRNQGDVSVDEWIATEKAIKEALAQTEPNYKKALEVWLDKTEWVQETVKPHELGMHRADVLKQRIEEALPQRTWVGLTDEDKSEICDMTERDERDSVMRLVEAKLKARNI
jgi:hypothetical protein